MRTQQLENPTFDNRGSELLEPYMTISINCRNITMQDKWIRHKKCGLPWIDAQLRFGVLTQMQMRIYIHQDNIQACDGRNWWYT